jgi:hypothetical protein
VLVDFVVSEKIAEHSKFYSDGEFVKECWVDGIDILCPNNSNDMHTVSLPRRTVTRRIDETAADLEVSLRHRTS